MDILTSKEIIHQEITKILNAYNSHTKNSDEKYEKLYEEWKQGKDMIHNLMEEIKEKDKLLFMNEKKFVDYETMKQHIGNYLSDNQLPLWLSNASIVMTFIPCQLKSSVNLLADLARDKYESCSDLESLNFKVGKPVFTLNLF